MSKHLLLRKGHFYFRQWVPVDLRSSFNGKMDITLSLMTKDKREALTLSGGLQQKHQLTFTLLRSGLLSQEHTQAILTQCIPCKDKHSERLSAKGTLGKQFGNWWSIHFNREYVTDDPQKTYHSFRHLFCNTLKQAGVMEVMFHRARGDA